MENKHSYVYELSLTTLLPRTLIAQTFEEAYATAVNYVRVLNTPAGDYSVTITSLVRKQRVDIS